MQMIPENAHGIILNLRITFLKYKCKQCMGYTCAHEFV